ncbi:hypothetical protein KUTeg_021308 [Tegillarca granosa]|uniref:Uncharacterized protein n=1 Tax=Tegillarca granosa TaxID=220873 RepID=A0ABQ9EEP4_TEGGR|nr:hypothetical protein KUTeg_021308 [Tegillarca granosa]
MHFSDNVFYSMFLFFRALGSRVSTIYQLFFFPVLFTLKHRPLQHQKSTINGFYDDLTEDDPIYNESKYGKMKEIKEKDETEKCSPFERIQEFEMQHCESVYQNNEGVMDDSAGEKRQSASELKNKSFKQHRENNLKE